MCQGNGTAPAAWLTLSSVLIMVYKSLGFGAKMESPITRVMLKIMWVLYVNDTDLFILNDFVSSKLNVHE